MERRRPALHDLDTSPDGFEWVDADDADARCGGTGILHVVVRETVGAAGA